MGVESIGHTVLKRYVTVLQVRIQCPASHAVAVSLHGSRSVESVPAHGFVGPVYIKVANALHIGIAQSCYAMITNHGSRIAVPAREDGQPTTLFIFIDQRLHHVTRRLRSYQVDERMQGTVRVPHAEVVVIVVPCGKLTHRLPTGKGRIAPVHIVERTREERSPVESAIEHTARITVWRLHLDQ